MRESKVATNITFKVAAQLVFLTGLAFVIHALVLQFVYPGYYDPLWPNHDDYYMPVALANSPASLGEYLRGPRPVGLMFFGVIGHLGLHGSIFAILCLIAINCAMAAETFRRVAKIKMGLPFIASFIVYLYLLFSHPYFYVFAIHDAFSQLSFTFLTISILPLYKYYQTRSALPLFVFLIAATLGFLAKETYGLSALFLASAWFIAKRKDGFVQAAAPAALTGVALGSAIVINLLNRSPFTSGSDNVDAPYHIVLNPSSVLAEWARYFADGLNPLTGAVILLSVAVSVIFLRRTTRWNFFAALLPVAGVIAWLPNALLPNHHYPEYSWSGTYLIFLPVLSLALFVQRGWILRACSFFILVATICSPIYFASAYKRNSWTLLQENIERNLLEALTGLTTGLPPDQRALRILITGIDFPFSPFKQPYSMKMFPHANDVSYDVVSYGPTMAQGDPNAGVSFIRADDVTLANYQYVWAFRSDGTLVKEVSDTASFIRRSGSQPGLDASDLLLYPRLLDALKSSPGKPMAKLNGYDYMKCGSILESYNDIPGATTCLNMSIMDIPTNPYPYFYLGKIQESQGLTRSAVESYKMAVALDNQKSPNPYFTSALSRVSLRNVEPPI